MFRFGKTLTPDIFGGQNTFQVFGLMFLTANVEEERACGADPDGLPSITLSDVLPSTIYLFVELPPRPEGSELSPSFVRLQLGSE